MWEAALAARTYAADGVAHVDAPATAAAAVTCGAAPVHALALAGAVEQGLRLALAGREPDDGEGSG